MRILISVLVLLTSFTNQAMADVCITEVFQNASYSDESIDHMFMDGEKLYYAAFSCQQLDNINTGVQAASIALGGAGIYAACTGVGLFATVGLETAALSLTGLSLVISNLNCEDTEGEEKIKQQVDEAICSALEAQGIECSPPLQEGNLI